MSGEVPPVKLEWEVRAAAFSHDPKNGRSLDENENSAYYLCGLEDESDLFACCKVRRFLGLLLQLTRFYSGALSARRLLDGLDTVPVTPILLDRSRRNDARSKSLVRPHR